MVEFVTFDEFENEIRRIIKEADSRQVPVRILGGAAIRMHCPNHQGMYEKLKRVPKHDMDFVTYKKFRPLTKKLFMDLGYEPYVTMMMTGATGRHRQIFNDKDGNKAIDVFLGVLEMCHDIDYEGRLEIDSPTVPLAELLLQKLQIVQTNEKDVQDTIILLMEHDIGKSDKDEINEDHIAKVLANDWGFYHTVNTKIGEIKEMLGRYDALSKEDRALLVERLDKLQKRIENEPKSFKWNMRAKAGTSVKWYRVVEEVQRD